MKLHTRPDESLMNTRITSSYEGSLYIPTKWREAGHIFAGKGAKEAQR